MTLLLFSKYHLDGFLLMLSIENNGKKVIPSMVYQQERIVTNRTKIFPFEVVCEVGMKLKAGSN